MAKLDNKKVSDDSLDDDIEPAADVLDGDMEDEDEEDLDSWKLEEDLE